MKRIDRIAKSRLTKLAANVTVALPQGRVQDFLLSIESCRLSPITMLYLPAAFFSLARSFACFINPCSIDSCSISCSIDPFFGSLKEAVV
jgi:hypothetical protein